MRPIAFVLPILLAACGGGGGGASLAPNGLPYASGTLDINDIEGRGTIKVDTVYTVTDWDTEETVLVRTKEELTVTDVDDGDFTLTLGGLTLRFENGQYNQWESGIATGGEYSATLIAFANTDAGSTSDPQAFDTESATLVGFQTSPSDLDSRNDLASYEGTFLGYGQYENGPAVLEGIEIAGDIGITIDFSDGLMIGNIDGAFDGSFDEFNGTFATTLSSRGRYTATMACNTGCSASNSEVVGQFYGPDASETSGVIAFDMNVDGNGTFLGAAGYTAPETP